MHLMYIDESGDTAPLTQKGKHFLVLTGCIIDENEIQTIEKQFREIKQKFYQNPDIEIKSNFLRYANPDLSQSSPLKLISRQIYNELESNITRFLKRIPVSLYSVIINKEMYWKRYPARNPYDTAYAFLLQRFQKYLDKNNSLGISIIDPREGQVEKHFIGNELAQIHNKMRWEDSEVWKQCSRIIEKLLFSQSDTTIGIQIADLFCYPIYHVFEYNKAKGEYWRFDELSLPKLAKNSKGEVDGFGLKLFPIKTKKDLRFFN